MSIAELAGYNKPDRERILYEGAKKEAKLMWYTSLTGGPNTDAPKVFEAKYPGIKLEVYRSDSDGIIQRVMQEAQAKRYIVGQYRLDSAMNKPEFKRFYAETGMSAAQYEKENEKWEKLLREIGKK
jgi:hypothetical protein